MGGVLVRCCGFVGLRDAGRLEGADWGGEGRALYYEGGGGGSWMLLDDLEMRRGGRGRIGFMLVVVLMLMLVLVLA